MSENSRRDAIKAAVAFIPVAAAVSTADAQSNGQSTKRDSSSKHEKKPDATMSPQEGRDSRMKFEALQRPAGPTSAFSTVDAQKFKEEIDQLIKTLATSESLTARLPTGRLESRFTCTTAEEEFSPIRCDSLAVEASALVAKCMELRREWETAYQTSYAFLSDLDRFNRLDAIFKVEEANGVYDIDSSASQADLQAAYVATFPLTNAAASIKAIYDDLTATFNDQYGWLQLLGWLSHISGYGQSGYATASVGWNGVTDEVVNYCYKAAVAQGLTQLQSQSNQLYSDYQSKQAQVDALNARFSGLQTRATWDIKNKQYRPMQVKAIRDLYKIKQQLANQPDGPLNFTERLARLQQLFDSTFSDALSRFQAISEGFAVLFGFDFPVPAEVLQAIQNPDTPPPSTNVLDVAVNWLDALGRCYTRFLHHEQTYSLCLSVKDAVSRDAWHKFLHSGELSLSVPEELFTQQYYVRCRAVGMYTVGLHGFCSARLQLPRKSYYIHRDLTKHAIDQSAIPVQRLSRVMPADGNKPTERVGMNTVFNCSPIGEWEISLSERTSNGAKRDRLSHCEA
jgi:hypothetical protein